ncbi:hypothetical protein PV-S19_0253 [Pacmanvirus S19]|nr:hypothetical protein PV-S19_0253 [Pacmanvirus S19]
MSTDELAETVETTDYDFRINGFVESFRVKNAEGAKLVAHGMELLTVPTSDYIVDFKHMMMDFYNKEYIGTYLDYIYKEGKSAEKYYEHVCRIYARDLNVTKMQIFMSVANDAPTRFSSDLPDEPDYRYFGLNMHRCVETKFTNCKVQPEITNVIRVSPELLPAKYQNIQTSSL